MPIRSCTGGTSVFDLLLPTDQADVAQFDKENNV